MSLNIDPYANNCCVYNIPIHLLKPQRSAKNPTDKHSPLAYSPCHNSQHPTGICSENNGFTTLMSRQTNSKCLLDSTNQWHHLHFAGPEQLNIGISFLP